MTEDKFVQLKTAADRQWKSQPQPCTFPAQTALGHQIASTWTSYRRQSPCSTARTPLVEPSAPLPSSVTSLMKNGSTTRKTWILSTQPSPRETSREARHWNELRGVRRSRGLYVRQWFPRQRIPQEATRFPTRCNRAFEERKKKMCSKKYDAEVWTKLWCWLINSEFKLKSFEKQIVRITVD